LPPHRFAGFSGFAAPAAPVKNIVRMDGGWARIGSKTRQSGLPAEPTRISRRGSLGAA